MAQNFGMELVAQQLDRPPRFVIRPNCVPGRNQRDSGTFASLARVELFSDRLNPIRNEFRTVGEKMCVTDAVTYWLRCLSGSANSPKTSSRRSFCTFSLSSIV